MIGQVIDFFLFEVPVKNMKECIISMSKEKAYIKYRIDLTIDRFVKAQEKNRKKNSRQKVTGIDFISLLIGKVLLSLNMFHIPMID